MKKLLSVFLLVFVLILAACSSDKSKVKDEPEEETPEVEEQQEQEEVEIDEPVVEEEQEAQEDDSVTDEEPEGSTWDDLKEQDKIIGKSDKDFSEITKSKPGEVRNDTTGKWRITKIAESIDIEDYALSYADLHMKDDEVHFIVNFNYNTTTWLNEMGGLLYVDIREYEKKEEHDAKKLGNGMVLKSYVIYPDGDIQELEE